MTDYDKACAHLKREFEKAEANAVVRDPISYALYKTWRRFDSRNRKENRNEKAD